MNKINGYNLKVILKIIFRQYLMHISCFLFPIIFIPLYMGIFIAINNGQDVFVKPEMKWFIITIILMCSSLIPFVFFYLSYRQIFNMIKSQSINNWTKQLIQFIIFLVLFYFIYYILNVLFIISYYLLIAYLIKINNQSILIYVLSGDNYQNSIVDNIIILINNKINWFGTIFNFIVLFFFNLSISGIYWIYKKNKNNYGLKVCFVYSILIILGSVFFISLQIAPRNNLFNFIFSFSPFYYGYWLVNLSWYDVGLFDMHNYSLIDNIPMFHKGFALNVYLYVYLFILLGLCLWLYFVFIKKNIKKERKIKYKTINNMLMHDKRYNFLSNNKQQFLAIIDFFCLNLNYYNCDYQLININSKLFFEQLTFNENLKLFNNLFLISKNKEISVDFLNKYPQLNCYLKKYPNHKHVSIEIKTLFNLLLMTLQNTNNQKLVVVTYINTKSLTKKRRYQYLALKNKLSNWLILDIYC